MNLGSQSTAETTRLLKPVFFLLSVKKRTALIYTSATAAAQNMTMVRFYSNSQIKKHRDFKFALDTHQVG